MPIIKFIKKKKNNNIKNKDNYKDYIRKREEIIYLNNTEMLDNLDNVEKVYKPNENIYNIKIYNCKNKNWR